MSLINDVMKVKDYFIGQTDAYRAQPSSVDTAQSKERMLVINDVSVEIDESLNNTLMAQDGLGTKVNTFCA